MISYTKLHDFSAITIFFTARNEKAIDRKKNRGVETHRLLCYNNPKILQSKVRFFFVKVKLHGFLKVLISLNVTKIV